jgi:hypothetical protein
MSSSPKLFAIIVRRYRNMAAAPGEEPDPNRRPHQQCEAWWARRQQRFVFPVTRPVRHVTYWNAGELV